MFRLNISIIAIAATVCVRTFKIATLFAITARSFFIRFNQLGQIYYNFFCFGFLVGVRVDCMTLRCTRIVVLHRPQRYIIPANTIRIVYGKWLSTQYTNTFMIKLNHANSAFFFCWFL